MEGGKGEPHARYPAHGTSLCLCRIQLYADRISDILVVKKLLKKCPIKTPPIEQSLSVVPIIVIRLFAPPPSSLLRDTSPRRPETRTPPALTPTASPTRAHERRASFVVCEEAFVCGVKAVADGARRRDVLGVYAATRTAVGTPRDNARSSIYLASRA